MTARLVVSLSGIDARNLHRCADMAADLRQRSVPLTLLLAPRGVPPVVAGWVRGMLDGTNDLLMHGFDHTADPRARSVALGRRAEFAALPAHEAGLRLTAALSTMDHIGLRTDGFAPPRWMASRGTRVALTRAGFTLCADDQGVHDLRTGLLRRGRVQTVNPRERGETWWCFALVLSAARTARRGTLVRIDATANDLARPGPRQAILDAVDIARHHGATPATYRDVLKDLTHTPPPTTLTPVHR